MSVERPEIQVLRCDAQILAPRWKAGGFGGRRTSRVPSLPPQKHPGCAPSTDMPKAGPSKARRFGFDWLRSRGRRVRLSLRNLFIERQLKAVPPLWNWLCFAQRPRHCHLGLSRAVACESGTGSNRICVRAGIQYALLMEETTGVTPSYRLMACTAHPTRCWNRR